MKFKTIERVIDDQTVREIHCSSSKNIEEV